jgi:hypothetical protein
MPAIALTELHDLRRASELTDEAAGLGRDRLLPVAAQFKTLLPGYGLRRGSVVGVTGTVPGTTSLLLALLSAASAAGSWCAVVGMPTMGFVAAAEIGIALDRLALVPKPGPDWPNVVAALIDGFDIVVIAGGAGIAASVCARMAARARKRGSVLVAFGSGWDNAEVTLSLTESRWSGPGEAASRTVSVSARGRGAAERPRKTAALLPDESGGLATAALSSVVPVGARDVDPGVIRMTRRRRDD